MEKLKAFIEPKITDLITFLDNKGKVSVYIVRSINGIYRYLEMIEFTTTLTTSGQRSNNFGPSYYTSIDTSTIQTFIAALHVQQKIIFQLC